MFRQHKHTVQSFSARIPSVKTVRRTVCGNKNCFNIHVLSLLMSSLRAIIICQKYFRITVISSQILLYSPSLVMRGCTLWGITICWEITREHLKRVRMANIASLLLRTPGPVPFRTSILSNIETVLSLSCRVSEL